MSESVFTLPLFEVWPKTPRLFNGACVVTEKIDGSNAQVYIEEGKLTPEPGGLASFDVPTDDYTILTFKDDNLSCPFLIRAGSRNRWLCPGQDNFGFFAWVKENASDLLRLGPGRHFGEWYGRGIQRGYGLTERRFALFNTSRWRTVEQDTPAPCIAPACCDVVPVLYNGPLDTAVIRGQLDVLHSNGSYAVPGWDKPEGVIVYLSAANKTFKVLAENDDKHKGEIAA